MQRMMSLQQAAQTLQGKINCSADAVCFTSVSTDSRRVRLGDLFVALQGPNFDGHDFVAAAKANGACAAVVARPVSVDIPLLQVSDTQLALGRLGLAWRAQFHGKLVALTGSNGKTTVKEMIAAILCQVSDQVLATQGNLNNEIGLPLTLLRLQPQHAYAVIEMGANHPGEIAYLSGLARPDVALITNAGPAHLQGFGDLDGVARAKGEIYGGLRADGIGIVNRDDQYADYWRHLIGSRQIVDFGFSQQAIVQGWVLDAATNRIALRVADSNITIQLPLRGRHNLSNALAAAAAAHALGVSVAQIGSGLESVSPVSGRLEWLSGPFGSTLINDTYNANPGSLAAAFTVTANANGQSYWLVLGDMAELGAATEAAHEQAGMQAREAGFEKLFALGEQSRRAADSFGSGAAHFADARALANALLVALRSAHSAPVVLIKGSRSMAMERIVKILREELTAATTQEAEH